MFGSFAKSTFNFFVAFVANQDNVVVFLRVAHGLSVHLRDQRTGRIDCREVTLGCNRVDFWRNPVSREHHTCAFGNLIGFLDEDRATLRQRFDDKLVVNDFLTDVDGRTVKIQGFFNNINRAINTRAISTRRCKQDLPTFNAGIAFASTKGVVMSHRSTVQAAMCICEP